MKTDLLRPGGKPAASVTDTQFIHEWADHLKHEGRQVIDASRGRPSLPFGDAGMLELQNYLYTMQEMRLAPYGTDTLGEPEYRKRVAGAFSRDYGTDFDWRRIAFTTGGQFGLAAAFYTILKHNPDGVIVTPSPWYLNHRELAHMALNMLGLPARELFVPLNLIHDDGFYIRAEDVQDVMAKYDNISAFLFCNPGNPVGNVLDERDLRNVTPLLDAFPDAPVMLDHAFFETRFQVEENATDPFLMKLQTRCFLFRSGTKALGFAGERLAVMSIPESCLEDFTFLQSRWMGNPPLSSQAILAGILEKLSLQDRRYIADYYQGNADLLYQELRARGLSCIHPPKGGFFTLMDASNLLGKPMPQLAKERFGVTTDTIRNDQDICFALLAGMCQPEGHHFATMPASCFGIDSNKGWLRLCFSISTPELEQMFPIFEQIAAA